MGDSKLRVRAGLFCLGFALSGCASEVQDCGAFDCSAPINSVTDAEWGDLCEAMYLPEDRVDEEVRACGGAIVLLPIERCKVPPRPLRRWAYEQCDVSVGELFACAREISAVVSERQCELYHRDPENAAPTCAARAQCERNLDPSMMLPDEAVQE